MNRAEIDLSLARESEFSIPAFDKKKIYVCLNKAADTLSKKAVIIGHGFTGKPDEYIHQIARDYFNDCGYDVYRLAYYRDESGYRKLHECTLHIHGRDLNAVLDYVRPQYDKIFVCGHSHGGLTMVFANPQATALSFWDPSYQPSRRWLLNSILSENGKYYERTGRFKFIIGKEMMAEIRDFSSQDAKEMTEKISSPSQVIIATNSWLGNDPEDLYADLICEKEKHTVKGADHCFAKGKTVYEMLEKTHKWFERF